MVDSCSMKDFGILMFNPQPEMPDLLANSTPGGQDTHYRFELKNVLVTSYSL